MAELTEKRKLGNLGEDLACRFLVKRGFSIVEKNYLRKWGEIDIIAKNGLKTHFVEVKSVSCENIPDQALDENKGGYRPEDNLHPWKLKRLAKTIQIYLLGKSNLPGQASEMDWQFDVITVYIDKKRLISKVCILENVIL